MATGGLYGNSGTGALIAQPGTETPGLYGKSPNGSVVAQPGSESAGLYGNGTTFGGSYFEWFVFQTSATQPATPTGGSWSFQTDSGTPPSGWTNAPASNPTNPVWISIALVNSKSTSALVWSTPGVLSYSGTINGSGAPTSGIGQIGELYIQTGVTPNALWFKSGSTTWTQITGSALYVDLTSNQTIAGIKTFSSTVQGDISGNAGTVTNGVYTNGTYVDPAWIASLAGSKITGNISGNAANVTGNVAIVNGGTGATTASGARTNLGLGTIAIQDASSVAITGGSITGITDLAIADGGTGASTAGQARTNLGLGTAAVLDAGVANGVATLDSGGTVPLSQIPASIQGGVSYQGAWNASTNTPTLTSSVGTKGYYYVVSVSGSTNLNGVTDWLVGDWAIFNGTVWEKIDNTDAVTSVNGYTGTVVLNANDVGALSNITSTDGSVTITTPSTGVRDLSVAVAGATTNVLCLVRNTTGATLTKGTVVYISGATGQNPTVSKAIATSDATSAQTLGMMTADLANNSNGYVTVIGLITNIDTSAYTDGAQLYLSGTVAGAVTATKPAAPIHLVYVAVVEHAHPTQGKLFVKVQNGYELDEIHDVSIVSPTTGQTLVYNATTDLWENSNAPVISGTTIDNTTIGATTPSTGVFTTLTAQNETLKGTGQNLVTQSQTFTNAAWTKSNASITSSTVTAPDATSTGSTLTEDTATNLHFIGVNTARAITSGIPIVLSAYVKANGRNYCALYEGSVAQGKYFNITAGGGGSVLGNFIAAPTSASLTYVGNDWYRISISVTSTSTFTYAIYISTDGTSFSYTGNGTSGISIWGAQVEVASTAGTYIPTTTTAVYGTPTLSFSGVASIGLQSDGSLYETSAGTGNVRFYTNNIGQEQARVSHTTSAVNYMQLTGAVTGGNVQLSAQGSDSSVGISLVSKGGGGSVWKGDGGVYFQNNAANNLFSVENTASTVNRLTATGGVAGSGPRLFAQGSDTNIDLNLISKGTGNINLGTGNGTQFRVESSGSAATDFVMVGGSSTGRPFIRSASASGNIDLAVSSQGTGAVRLYTNFVGQEQARVSHTASAVNYVQVTGAATGAPSQPIISAQGSDANINIALQGKGTGSAVLLDSGGGSTLRAIPRATGGDTWVDVCRSVGGVSLQASSAVTNGALIFQSKGTGAIDLAAGSSGVNISNGGTVTAITRTSSGSGYTSIPSAVISAPTTAGGTQATLSPGMAGATATVVAGGTGYTVGDTLTIVGATGTASQFTVATLSGSAVATVTFAVSGNMTALPTNPVSVTGGTGSGATFTMTYALAATQASFTAGSGYVEQPTVTFSGGGGSGAAAYATVGANTVVRSLNDLSIFTPGGEQVRVADRNLSVVNYVQLSGASTTNAPRVSGQGSDTNVVLFLSSKGNAQVSTYTNNFTVEQFRVAHTASAVNYVQVTGAATGGIPTISVQGSDTNAGMLYNAKGFGSHEFRGYNGSNTYLTIGTSQASPVNSLQLAASSSGNAVSIKALGTDTNIPLVLQPKGTGALQAQQTDSTATGGNARGANAVDWQTSRDAASRVASGQYSVVGGGYANTSSSVYSAVFSGLGNTASGVVSVVAGGQSNVANGNYSTITGGVSNSAAGWMSFIGGGNINTTAGYFSVIGGGYTNSGTSGSAVTTQSGTMNGTTAVTLSGSNASIKVGQYITGTSIATDTYVAAISGTSLTLSKAASGSSTSTLSFYTPHGVVVGGGNNQATGSYSFIGGGGDAGTAANRNVASGDWSFVGGGQKNVASGRSSVVVGGFSNTASTDGAAVVGGGFYAGNAFPNNASGTCSFIGGGFSNQTSGFGTVVVGGNSNIGNGTYSMAGGLQGTNRLLHGAFNYSSGALTAIGDNQYGIYLAKKQTTDATATVLTFDNSAAGTTNQVILPNNSAYYFKVEIIANVTGGGNTSGWELKGVIKRGANAASTAIVGSVTSTLIAQDAGASTWVVSATADTTNGGLKITVTGQASTTIRWVAKASTTEVTF